MTTETTTNDYYRLACSVLDLVEERHENGDHDTLPQEQQVMDLLHAAANEGYSPLWWLMRCSLPPTTGPRCA